jgi:hypothetical protein
MRPPYGEYDNTVISAVGPSDGAHPMGCRQFGLERPERGGDHKGVVSKVQPAPSSCFTCRAAYAGGLAHDHRAADAGRVQFAPVSECSCKESTEIDHTGGNFRLSPGKKLKQHCWPVCCRKIKKKYTKKDIDDNNFYMI